jgi:cell volume regulation protein A
MRDAEPLEPYATGLRFRTAPEGLFRYTVGPGSAADGAVVADLGLGDQTWLSLLRREGRLVPLRRDTRLHAGDQVLAQSDDDAGLEQLFRSPEG